jgi:hypothetical protein
LISQVAEIYLEFIVCRHNFFQAMLPAVRRLACVGWQGRGITPLARWMGTSFDDVVREKVDANPDPLTTNAHHS